MPAALKKPIPLLAYSVSRASAALDGIKQDRIGAAIRAGEIPVYQLGTKRRILRDDLVAWVKTWKKVAA